jgi:hypothetical protein
MRRALEEKFRIGDAVRPLFTRQPNGEWAFSGTGFFVEHDGKPVLVTADHVALDEPLWICKDPPNGRQFHLDEILVSTRRLRHHRATDVALYDPLEFAPEMTLDLCSVSPFGNYRVGTFEYARLMIDPQRALFNLGGSTRIGNIVRQVSDDSFPQDSLELSYPALKGASGAPVVVLEGPDKHKVAGFLKANVQYELLPVQTYMYKDERGGVEEKLHYHLPAGLAVDAKWVTELLQELGETSRNPRGEATFKRNHPERS